MEDFRDIPGYEGLYQVSNLGNVKSLSREIRTSNGFRISKEIILKPSTLRNGYYYVGLWEGRINKPRTIHQLVAMAFLNHKPNGYKIVVDHINKTRKDNRVENLQVITQRENISKLSGVFSSKYTGVSWNKKLNKWSVKIVINKKQIHLGYFNCELAASQAYQNKLKEIS